MIRINLITLTIAIVFLFAGCGKNEVKTADNKTAPEVKTEQVKTENVTTTIDKNVKTVEFKCKDMECSSCENKISDEVKKMNGVKEVIADSKTKTTKVIYAAGQVSEKEIESAINKAGFKTETSKSDVKNDTPVESKDKKSCGSKNCCKDKK